MGRAAVIGDGAWGTALALCLHRNGHAVTVWGPDAETIRETRVSRENRRFLPTVVLPSEIEWTAEPAAALEGARIVVFAVPSRFAASVLARMRAAGAADAVWVSVTKGLDPEHNRTMTAMMTAALGGGVRVAAMSGPSFAEEVARGGPTAVVAASADPGVAEEVQRWFAQAAFRVYTSDDVLGVELGGVLKNVVAIAAGACDGLGLGENAKAALVTRGLAEMMRMGVALGARAETFAGLSGVGDLMLTCYGRASRNRTLGERLGRGDPAATLLAGATPTVEGAVNCRRVAELARTHGVEMPIAEAVRDVLDGALTCGEAVERLLRREPKPEHEPARAASGQRLKGTHR